MHLRNSRKQHGPIKISSSNNHNDAPDESAKVTMKQRRLRIKELSEAIKNFALDEKSIYSPELLRHVLRHLYEYPLLAKKLYADDFCITAITDRVELAKKSLNIFDNFFVRRGAKPSKPLPTPEQLADDVHHIMKIMQRYKLSFDQAFDYRLMNIALRMQYGFVAGRARDHYVPKCYTELTVENLLTIGKSVGLTAAQVMPLLPSLQQKIILGTQRHVLKKGLFGTEADKQSKLAQIKETVEKNMVPKLG